MESTAPTSRSAGRLAGLRCEINEWRSTCSGPQGRMPERLWREAVLLAGELGPERVAQSLELNPSALGRRLGRLEPTRAVPRSPVFLDVTPASSPPSPVTLEVLARDGTRLRFQGPLDDIRSLVLSV